MRREKCIPGAMVRENNALTVEFLHLSGNAPRDIFGEDFVTLHADLQPQSLPAHGF
jgi:hypothetical protein